MSTLKEKIDQVFDELQSALLNDTPDWQEVNLASRKLISIGLRADVMGKERLKYLRRAIEQHKQSADLCEEHLKEIEKADSLQSRLDKTEFA